MRKTNKVAIILASFNGEKYIKEQLCSILKQEKVTTTTFIFDDNSSDNTIHIIKKNFSKESVCIHTREKSSGSAARSFFHAIQSLDNHIVDNYDYFSLADQDDIWLPNKLNRAVTKLIQEKASLYASNLTLWVEKTGKKSIIKKDYKQKKKDFLFEGGSAGCTYVFNKEVMIGLRNILTNINFEHWEQVSHDWFIYFFCRLHSKKVFLDKESHILYRIHSNNTYGHLSALSFSTIISKMKMIRHGWYTNNIKGFKQLIDVDSELIKVYNNYSKNILSRIYVVTRYNTSLIRDYKKFILFALLSLIPIKNNIK